MAIRSPVLRLRRWLTSFSISGAPCLCLTLLSLLTALCGVVSFALFFLSSLHTSFSMISSGLFVWSVLSLLLMFLLGIFFPCSAFFTVLPLNLCPPVLFETIPGRSSSWPLLAGWASFRLCPVRCLCLGRTCFSHTFWSSAQRPSLPPKLFLGPSAFAPDGTLLVIFPRNSCCVRCVLCVSIILVLPLFLRVLVPCLFFLVLLLALFLRTLLVSYFVRSFLRLLLPLPALQGLLLLLHLPILLDSLALLLPLRFVLIAFAGLLLRLLLLAMLLSLLFSLHFLLF